MNRKRRSRESLPLQSWVVTGKDVLFESAPARTSEEASWQAAIVEQALGHNVAAGDLTAIEKDRYEALHGPIVLESVWDKVACTACGYKFAGAATTCPNCGSEDVVPVSSEAA